MMAYQDKSEALEAGGNLNGATSGSVKRKYYFTHRAEETVKDMGEKLCTLSATQKTKAGQVILLTSTR